jgi:hypothetical protein
MILIPLNPVPSQTLSIQLDSQNCQINIYQEFYGIFCDLYVDNSLIIAGTLCLNLTRLVRSLYLGFSGDLSFIDTQGSTDPYYTGLGSRYQFVYLETTDLPPGVG